MQSLRRVPLLTNSSEKFLRIQKNALIVYLGQSGILKDAAHAFKNGMPLQLHINCRDILATVS